MEKAMVVVSILTIVIGFIGTILGVVYSFVLHTFISGTILTAISMIGGIFLLTYWAKDNKKTGGETNGNGSGNTHV